MPSLQSQRSFRRSLARSICRELFRSSAVIYLIILRFIFTNCGYLSGPDNIRHPVRCRNFYSPGSVRTKLQNSFSMLEAVLLLRGLLVRKFLREFETYYLL